MGCSDKRKVPIWSRERSIVALYVCRFQAMRFPQDPQPLELESGEKRRERQQQEQELANTIAEEEGDDF